MVAEVRPREVLNDFVLKVFRLNGRLLDAADRLTEGSGLTAARWQVLGAVLHEPLTVAAAARSMGLARQSVQRLADALVEDGLCQYLPNPAHRRAKLIAPTDRGWQAIEQIRPGVVAWGRRVTKAVGEEKVVSASAAVDALLLVLASPEGQVNRQALPAHLRDRRKSK
ncbi:MAG: MarR family transcriptional regulator [Deltaproteobacteria bacterium]|nr:MarR family transcriptional regulator [Deltaproteobacteria bacterium]